MNDDTMIEAMTDDTMIEARRTVTVCLRCHYPMTWEQQRRQFGRLMRKGFTKDEAKAALPRCQICMTVWLRAYRLSSITDSATHLAQPI
jgi:SOS response regulatory protein OraA/RecX